MYGVPTGGSCQNITLLTNRSYELPKFWGASSNEHGKINAGRMCFIRMWGVCVLSVIVSMTALGVITDPAVGSSGLGCDASASKVSAANYAQK